MSDKKLSQTQNWTKREWEQYATELEEQKRRRNERRRQRRQWLKTAPREDTVLRPQIEGLQEKPCNIAQYLLVERSLLNKLDTYPELKGDAVYVLLGLTHNLH